MELNDSRFGIVIAGMHHSGSSLLARALRAVGCDIADSCTAARANPIGESVAISTLNDDVLAAGGSNAADWLPFVDRCSDSDAAQFRARARAILEDEFGDSQLFVLNDPRTSRVLDFWIDSLQATGVTPLVVSPIRDPAEVVRAMEWRNPIDAALCQLVWLRYVLDAEAASRRTLRCFVRYTDLRDDWKSAVDRIGHELAITWPRAGRSVEDGAAAPEPDERPDTTLRDAPHVVPNQSRLVTPVFEILDRWGGSGIDDADHAALDALRSAFDAAASDFGQVITLGQAAASRNCYLEERDAARQVELGRRLNERGTLQAKVEALEAQVAALRTSTSWRATAPLRSLGEMRSGRARRRRARSQPANGPPALSISNASGQDRKLAPIRRGVDRLGGSASDSYATGQLRTMRRRPRSIQRALVWLYRSDVQKSGLMMRGKQLSQMVRERIGDGISVRYASEQEAPAITGAVIILTRSFLARATVAELETLRAAGNIVCVDYIDWPVREELDDPVDVYIASSVKQLLHYRERYPHKLVHHITHHADPAIANVPTPTEYCNIGYFGEVGNALHRQALQGFVDFVQTNNSEYISRDWLHRLRHCNVHYSVRDYMFPFRSQRPDSFKPFTKGFTAAQCNANIIVPKDESDAEHYLGADYPYLLPDDSLDSVWAMIHHVKDSFRSPEWYRGLERMAWVRRRCSTEYIVAEVRDLLRRCREWA